MNRRLLALALLVFSQLIVPCAFAQGSNVVIYGTFNADFENVERDGATAAGSAGNGVVGPPSAANALNQGPRNRVSSNSSNIGFAGPRIWGPD